MPPLLARLAPPMSDRGCGGGRSVAMAHWSLWLTLTGLVLTLLGAGRLLLKIKPKDPRYVDDGMLHPGDQQSQVLPQFIRDQQRPALVVLIGGALQTAGSVLALLAG